MSLAERRLLRLFTLCILYVAQGIPWGFMAITLPAYLKGQGASHAEVGAAFAMTTLPYALKWVWGPLMDLFTIPSLGRRRPWIMFAQLMMALTVLVIVILPDLAANLELLAVIVLIHTVFNSMQDVATDALAVDLLDDDERGRANGLTYACKFGGGIIGGAGMGRMISEAGLSTALVIQTAILLAIMLVPLLVRERSGPPPPRPPLREIAEGFGQAATLRSTLAVGGLVLLLNISLGVVGVAAVGLYTAELKWEIQKYTDLVGGLGMVIGFGGSILGGFLSDLLGRRRIVAIASIGMAVGWLVFAVAEPLWGNDTFIYMIATWAALCQSVMLVSTYALCMDVSWSRIAATQFAGFMALSSLSSTIGYKLAAPILGELSYQGVYVAAGGVQIAVTAILLVVDPSEARRKLPLRPGWTLGASGIATIVLFATVAGILPVVLFLI